MQFIKACENLQWNHEIQPPHRSEPSGIAERAVRQVKAGTSSILIRSGLPELQWEEAVECHCYLGNIQDSLADGRQNTARKKIRYTICKTKVVPARSIGYILNAERYWLGDFFIVDTEERKNNPATDIHVKRYKAKEVEERRIQCQHMFPCKNGSFQQEPDVPTRDFGRKPLANE